MHEFYTDNPLRKSDTTFYGSPNSSTEAEISSTRAAFNANTPGSDDGRNGHDNQDAHSPLNEANGSGDNVTQSVENNEGVENGSSDAHLKVAANDPATHEHTVAETGLPSLATSSKRKSPDEHTDEPSKKISKTSSSSDTLRSNPATEPKPRFGARELEEGEEEEEEEEGELEE